MLFFRWTNAGITLTLRKVRHDVNTKGCAPIMPEDRCCNRKLNENSEENHGDYVCHCNRVTEQDIINAINGGAQSVEEVIALTGALQNSNCIINNPKGSCCYPEFVYVFNKYRKTMQQR